MKLSEEFRNSLGAMAQRYHEALRDSEKDSPAGLAREYLASRGIGPEAIASYRLGIADGSYDDHKHFQGMISIPYDTKLGGIVSLKFRRAHDCALLGCEHAKYLTPYSTWLYNTLAMDRADRIGLIALTEGELNAITLTHCCGIPAVGIPGVETWKQHMEWPAMFAGYPEVLMFPDWDEPDQRHPDPGGPGEALAKAVRKDIDTVRMVRLPDGMDPNDAYAALGAAKIREVAKIT